MVRVVVRVQLFTDGSVHSGVVGCGACAAIYWAKGSEDSLVRSAMFFNHEVALYWKEKNTVGLPALCKIMLCKRMNVKYHAYTLALNVGVQASCWLHFSQP